MSHFLNPQIIDVQKNVSLPNNVLIIHKSMEMHQFTAIAITGAGTRINVLSVHYLSGNFW